MVLMVHHDPPKKLTRIHHEEPPHHLSSQCSHSPGRTPSPVSTASASPILGKLKDLKEGVLSLPLALFPLVTSSFPTSGSPVPPAQPPSRPRLRHGCGFVLPRGSKPRRGAGRFGVWGWGRCGAVVRRLKEGGKNRHLQEILELPKYPALTPRHVFGPLRDCWGRKVGAEGGIKGSPSSPCSPRISPS